MAVKHGNEHWGFAHGAVRRAVVGVVVGLCAMSVAGCASGAGEAAAKADAAADLANQQPAGRSDAAPDLSPAAMEAAASARSPVLGRPATAFSLPNQDEQDVTLPADNGRWSVLYFYPKNDTPGCTCEATEFTDLLGRFHSLDADVYGVSPDLPGDHRFFRAKYKLKVTLLSDPKKTVMSRYGAWVDTQVAGIDVKRVVRSTFLIDPQGRIAWHWPEVIPKGHASRVHRKLEALRAQAAGAAGG